MRRPVSKPAALQASVEEPAVEQARVEVDSGVQQAAIEEPTVDQASVERLTSIGAAVHNAAIAAAVRSPVGAGAAVGLHSGGGPSLNTAVQVWVTTPSNSTRAGLSERAPGWPSDGVLDTFHPPKLQPGLGAASRSTRLFWWVNVAVQTPPVSFSVRRQKIGPGRDVTVPWPSMVTLRLIRSSAGPQPACR